MFSSPNRPGGTIRAQPCERDLCMNKPGQSCPPHYRYQASDFRMSATLRADTVYVVGGLYGNLDALHEILRMRHVEAQRGTQVQLVFNGDHNWFDADAHSFAEINQTALESIAIRGNVEA